jgi:hypothetical protein
MSLLETVKEQERERQRLAVATGATVAVKDAPATSFLERAKEQERERQRLAVVTGTTVAVGDTPAMSFLETVKEQEREKQRLAVATGAAVGVKDTPAATRQGRFFKTAASPPWSQTSDAGVSPEPIESSDPPLAVMRAPTSRPGAIPIGGMHAQLHRETSSSSGSNGQPPPQQEQGSSTFLVTAELVDEERVRREALEQTVVARAELMKGESERNTGSDQNDKGPSERRRRVMVGFVVFAVTIIVAVVVAVLLSGDNGVGNSSPLSPPSGDEGTRSPTTSPTTATPTLLPTAAPTRVILQEVSGPLFGNLNPISDFELADPSISIGGGFGRQVAIQTTQGVTTENSDDNDDATFTVIASYAERQIYQGDRRLRLASGQEQRDLSWQIIEDYQLAIFACSATLGCDTGTPVVSDQIMGLQDFWGFAFALPSLGLGGNACFLALWELDWVYTCENLICSPFTEDIPVFTDEEPIGLFAEIPIGTSTTSIVDINRLGDRMAIMGNFSLFVYDSTSCHSPTLLSNWTLADPYEVPSAVAIDDRRVVLGTNLEIEDDEFDNCAPCMPEGLYYDGYIVRVFDDTGEGIGQVLNSSEIFLPEEKGNKLSILSQSSIAMAANGTVLAVGSAFAEPTLTDNILLRNDLGQVDVWRLDVESSLWIPLGSTLLSSSFGDMFGSALALNEDGTILAVGAPGNRGGGIGAGRVSLYELVADEWIPLTQDLVGSIGSAFGRSVALSPKGDWLVVGAPESGVRGELTGEIRVYRTVGV